MLKPGVNFREFASESENGSSKSETNDVKKIGMDKLKYDIFPDFYRANYLRTKVRSENLSIKREKLQASMKSSIE